MNWIYWTVIGLVVAYFIIAGFWAHRIYKRALRGQPERPEPQRPDLVYTVALARLLGLW